MKVVMMGLIFLLAGCEISTHKVQGESVNDYYSQFFYEKGSGDYRLLNVNAISLDASSKHSYSILVALKENHTFEIQYDEFKDSLHFAEESVAGTWEFVGGRIELEGVGYLSAIEYNGVDTVEIHFDRDLHSPGLRNTTELLWTVYSKVPLE